MSEIQSMYKRGNFSIHGSSYDLILLSQIQPYVQISNESSCAASNYRYDCKYK